VSCCPYFLQALKPHIFVSVPRLWNRIYDRVMATMREANPVKRRMFETAFAYKRAALEAGECVVSWECVRRAGAGVAVSSLLHCAVGLLVCLTWLQHSTSLPDLHASVCLGAHLLVQCVTFFPLCVCGVVFCSHAQVT
jgi:long-subunit acyl-CoA synthetase (AMP-forming)